MRSMCFDHVLFCELDKYGGFFKTFINHAEFLKINYKHIEV